MRRCSRRRAHAPATPLLAVLAAAALACAGRPEPVEPVSGPVADVRSTGQLFTWTGAGGAELAGVRYAAAEPRRRTLLVYLHGIESHAGWFDLAARRLAAAGYDVTCLDRRGSGLNREGRGFVSGHVDAYETLFADIRRFLSGVDADRYDARYGVGLSWGGKLVLAYALARPDDFEGLVLITPGLRAHVDVPPATKLGIVFGTLLWPRAQFDTPIESEMFTSTPRYLNFIRRDPLKLHTASARFFWQSRRLDGFVDDHMPANRLPILLFLAGRDRIIDNDAVLEVLRRGDQERLDVRTYEDQTHSIQFDAPERLTRDMDAWLGSLREGAGPG